MEIQGLEDCPPIKQLVDSQGVRYELKKAGGELLPLYNLLSQQVLQTLKSELNQQQAAKIITQALALLKLNPRGGMPRVCGSSMTKGYTCYDCSPKRSVNFCEACFDRTKHIGHQYIRYQKYSGYSCDCGYPSRMSPSSFCSKHAEHQLPEVNIIAQTSEVKSLVDLLYLGVKFIRSGSELNRLLKEGFLQGILTHLAQLALKSNYYEALISKALVSEEVTSQLLRTSSKSFARLMVVETWPDPVEKAISRFLDTLTFMGELGKQVVAQVFRVLSSAGSKFGHKVRYMSFYVKKLLSLQEVASSLLLEPNIQNLVKIKEQTIPEVTWFYLETFNHLFDQFPEIFCNLILEIQKHVPLCKWFGRLNSKQPTSNDQKAGDVTLKFFKAIESYSSNKDQRDQFCKKIIQDFFQILLSERLPLEADKIFMLAVLVLYNFDLEPFYALSKKDLKQLLFRKSYNKKAVLPRLQQIIFSLGESGPVLPKDLKNPDSEINLRKVLLNAVYLKFSIFIKIFDTLSGGKERIIPLYLKKVRQELEIKKAKGNELRHSVSVFKQMAGFVKFYIFSTESPVAQQLLSIEIRQKTQEEEAFEMCRQLTILSFGKGKAEFKVMAEKWIGKQSLIRKFAVIEFDKVKKQDFSQLKVQASLSMNSPLCMFASPAEKKTRFQVKFRGDPQAKPAFASLNQSEVLQVISFYEQFMQNYRAIYANVSNPEITSFIDDFFEMFMTIFLDTKNLAAKAKMENIIAQQWLKAKLSLSNKEIMAFYLEEAQNSRGTTEVPQLVDKKKLAFLTKKDKMMSKIKKNQKETLQKRANISIIQQQAEENPCIVCGLGEDREALYYLSYVRFSKVLMKQILKREKSILLVTTCGHLIHQHCLKTSLGDKKNYYTYFKCFLCNNLSNLRIPFKAPITDQREAQELFNQILTIIAIQRESKFESILDPTTRKMYENDTLTESNFAEQIFNAFIYLIHLYFLSHSQLFNYYMLPIMPNLLQILRYHLKISQPTYRLSGQKDEIVLYIESRLKLVLAEKERELRESAETVRSASSKNDSEAKLTNEEKKVEISKLFLKILGDKQVETRKIKDIERMNVRKPPQDLLTLKRLKQTCKYCDKPSDNIRMCSLCGVIGCFKCNQYWCHHMNTWHAGNNASIIPKTGSYFYDNSNIGYHVHSLYKNYLGQFYEMDRESKPDKIEEGQYTLDNAQYEKYLEDIVLDKIERKTEQRMRQQQDQMEEMGLGNLQGRNLAAAAAAAARAGGGDPSACLTQ